MQNKLVFDNSNSTADNIADSVSSGNNQSYCCIPQKREQFGEVYGASSIASVGSSSFGGSSFDSSHNTSSNDNIQHHSSTPVPDVLKVGSDMRQGQWTAEEENYCEQLIVDFSAGILDIPPRTHLRYYLSVVLNCQQMRISTKYRKSDKGKSVSAL